MWTGLARGAVGAGGGPAAGRADAPAFSACCAAARCCAASDSGRWTVRQVLDDPAGDHDWAITAEVDLAASDEAGTAVVRVVDVGAGNIVG